MRRTAGDAGGPSCAAGPSVDGLGRRGSRPEDDGQLRRLAVAQDVELDAVAGRVLAGDDVERVRRVERRAVDGGDDVAGLEAALRRRAAGHDGSPDLVGAMRVGIQAPLATGRLLSFWTVGSMVSKRMPRYGRASGWPAEAWVMSGRAMSIGMAKPMPWAAGEPAVLMPMTLPLGSSSGPPLLPGLMAVSVWMRLVRMLAALDRDAPAERPR